MNVETSNDFFTFLVKNYEKSTKSGFRLLSTLAHVDNPLTGFRPIYNI